MAYIEKTKSGKYRAHVDKRGVRDSETFDTQREAKDWGAKREAEIMAVGRGQLPKVTLAYAMDVYLARVSRTKGGCRWEELRIEYFKRTYPKLAGKIMSETTTADWAEWRDHRLQTVKGSTVLREIHLWSAIYHKCTHEIGPYCAGSPLTKLGKPKGSKLRDQRWRWRTTREVLRWFGYVSRWVPRYKGTQPKDKREEVAYAILVALRTAMRLQEVLSLSDDNCNLVTRVAVVNHKMQYATGEPRKVPMQPQAVHLLGVLSARPLGPGGRYFATTPSRLDGLWRKHRDNLAMASPEVGALHFHDTRAEAITRLSRKEDVLTLSAISGIKDLKLLNERYYREQAEEVAARL